MPSLPPSAGNISINYEPLQLNIQEQLYITAQLVNHQSQTGGLQGETYCPPNRSGAYFSFCIYRDGKKMCRHHGSIYFNLQVSGYKPNLKFVIYLAEELRVSLKSHTVRFFCHCNKTFSATVDRISIITIKHRGCMMVNGSLFAECIGA